MKVGCLDSRSGAVSLTIANLALPASALIISPVLARGLGPGDRGSLAAYLAVTLLAPGLFGTGLQDALTSLGSASPVTEGLWPAGRHYAYRAAAIAGVLTTGICLFVAGRDPRLAVLCGVYTGTMILFMPVRARLLCDGAFARVAIERWIQVGCRIAGIGFIFKLGLLSVSSALFVQLLAIAVGSLSLLNGHQGRLTTTTPKVVLNASAMTAVARFTRNAALGSVGLVILLRLDQILLKPLASAFELGIYAIAVGIAEIPLAVSAAMRSFVIPKVARERSTACVRPILSLTSGLGVMLTIIIMLFGRDAINLVYGEAFDGAFWPMVVLSAATIAAMASDVLNAVLVGLGNPRSQSTGVIAAAMVTVALLVVLIPACGAMGAALATLASFLTATCIAAIKVRQEVAHPRRAGKVEVAS